MFDQAQLDHLSTLRFINNVDDKLKIISAVQLPDKATDHADQISLSLELFYESDRVSELSFNLHNFNYEEIVDLARNVKNCDFIMQEVDAFLSGDIEQ